MRISAYRDDPGFATFTRSVESGRDVTVLLDGERISRGWVLTADEEEGVVFVVERSDSSDSEMVITEKHGRVSVYFSD